VGIQDYVVTHFWIPCLRRAGRLKRSGMTVLLNHAEQLPFYLLKWITRNGIGKYKFAIIDAEIKSHNNMSDSA
jgi:hypothetical protein